jgi:protein associated with RNAse G/E
MKTPKEGDFVTIQSYKHDGSLHRTWRETMLLKVNENSLIGVNDHTLVTESDDRRWVTREPAIVYFHKKFWFNIIAMIREEGVSYYCNLASPYTLDAEALKYIDYDLDVKVFASGDRKLLDVEEYERHRKQMDYPADIDFILRENVKILNSWIREGYGPFSKEYIDIWYKRYLQLKT